MCGFWHAFCYYLDGDCNQSLSRKPRRSYGYASTLLWRVACIFGASSMWYYFDPRNIREHFSVVLVSVLQKAIRHKHVCVLQRLRLTSNAVVLSFTLCLTHPRLAHLQYLRTVVAKQHYTSYPRLYRMIQDMDTLYMHIGKVSR